MDKTTPSTHDDILALAEEQLRWIETGVTVVPGPRLIGRLERAISSYRSDKAEIERLKSDVEYWKNSANEELNNRCQRQRVVEKQQAALKALVEAGEALKGTAQSYAMQTYDRLGVTARKIEEWDKALALAQEFK